jgi:hypothetical protein
MLRVAEPSSEVAPPQGATPETAADLLETSVLEPLVRTRLTPGTVLALQRSAGNVAVTRLLRQDDGGAAPSAPEPSAPVSAAGGAQPDGLAGAAADGAEADAEVKLDPIVIPSQGPIEVEVFAAGPQLEGKTHAGYTSTDPVVAPNPPKASKAPGGKIRAQGTVTSTFASNPTVDPYDLDSHGFTDCQHKNAEKFVKNVLDPHEQQHVAAFKKNFDGNWSKPFDLTVKDAADATEQVKAIYDKEFADRKKKADDASADLDSGGKNQFVWDMDEGCTDDKAKQ